MNGILFLAFLLPLPLAFSYVIPLWSLLLYESIVFVYFLSHRRGRALYLSPARVNLLSGLCLVLFLVDALFISSHLIQVADHLALALMLIKIHSIETKRDFSQFLLLAFFIFLSATAMATHVLILPYLFTALSGFLFTLMEWSQGPLVFRRQIITGALIFSSLMAIPLFFIFPRVERSYLGGLIQNPGIEAPLAPSITIGSITSLRNDRRPLLRVKLSGNGRAEDLLRLRGLTFDHNDGIHWERRLLGLSDSRIERSAVMDPEWSAEIFIRPQAFPYLPVPYRTMETRIPTRFNLYSDGTREIRRPGVSAFKYEISGHPDAPLFWDSSSLDSWLETTADDSRYREITESIADPHASTADVVRALERWFHTEFTYTLDPEIPENSDPVIYFLTRSRSGHCELFASAMTMMLRSIDVPSRVVGGYLGGDLNPFQDYYIVRQSHAHAWVEVFYDGAWHVSDPTPPDGQPAISLMRSRFLEGIIDSVSFFWDRHILPFGKEEQVHFFFVMRKITREHRVLLRNLFYICVLSIAVLTVSMLGSKKLYGQNLGYRLIRGRLGKILKTEPSNLTPDEVLNALKILIPSRRDGIHHYMNHYKESSFGLVKPGKSMGLTALRLWLHLMRVKSP